MSIDATTPRVSSGRCPSTVLRVAPVIESFVASDVEPRRREFDRAHPRVGEPCAPMGPKASIDRLACEEQRRVERGQSRSKVLTAPLTEARGDKN